MNISHLNLPNIAKAASSGKEKIKEAKTEQTNTKQFSSQSSNAALAYGKASIAINKTAPAADKKENTPPNRKQSIYFILVIHMVN